MAFETVSVIGLGYIGLPTAAMFASKQCNVIGVDVNRNTVETINRGEIHIVEPGLDKMVKVAVSDSYLKATLVPEAADAFLIAVPTPFKSSAVGSTPEPDLAYIRAAAKAIAPVLQAGNLVILESTSPVGATEQLSEWLAAERKDLIFPGNGSTQSDIYVAHCPERVLPGQVIRELVENDRVIGGMTPESSVKAVELYKTFVEGECVVTNARTAEMAKLTENSCRDVQIAFANELSVICDKLDIDVWELISLANRHPRINILQPGPGVGGHCIAVDPWFIVSKTPEDAKIIRCAREVNEAKPQWVIGKVAESIAGLVQSGAVEASSAVKIACLGLAFKADIDDLRESPALKITRQLADQYKGQVVAVEPNIEQLSDNDAEQLSLLTLDEALSCADIVLVLVDHREFKRELCRYTGSALVIDTRGIVQSV